jgi:hypothetical protein
VNSSDIITVVKSGKSGKRVQPVALPDETMARAYLASIGIPAGRVLLVLEHQIVFQLGDAITSDQASTCLGARYSAALQASGLTEAQVDDGALPEWGAGPMWKTPFGWGGEWYDNSNLTPVQRSVAGSYAKRGSEAERPKLTRCIVLNEPGYDEYGMPTITLEYNQL